MTSNNNDNNDNYSIIIGIQFPVVLFLQRLHCCVLYGNQYHHPTSKYRTRINLYNEIYQKKASVPPDWF